MKIILDDFSYRGYYFKQLDFEIPDVKKLEDITCDMLSEHVIDDLDSYINFHESFMTEDEKA